MSAGKHTPGPWRWGVDFNGLCGPHKGMEVLRFQVYEGMWLEYGEHQEANARLIAAAPELLHALEMMILFNRPMKGNAVALHNAYEAIAKATGSAK